MIEELIERYILYLSQSTGKTNEQVIKHIDECIKKLTIQYNKPYTLMREEIFNEEFLIKCLNANKLCSSLELKECQESCHCVWLDSEETASSSKGVCYPRYFENAEEINSDPDKYLVGLSTERLQELVRLADHLYHNYEGGGLSDNSYDAFRYTLQKRLKIKGNALSKVGAPPIKKIRTTLPYSMGSLEKIKPGTRETLDFLFQTTPKETIQKEIDISWSLKLDGVSGMLVYSKGGKLENMYTRGDGTIGGDISYLIPYIKKGVPNLEIYEDFGSLVVRGEFVIQKRLFQEKYSTSYSNPRSFVSSKINSGCITEGISDITFLAYAVIDIVDSDGDRPDPTEPSKTFRILNEMGFFTPDNGILKTPTVFEVLELYKTKRSESEWLIDGLVLAIDLNSIDLIKYNIKRSIVAFKAQLEEQQRKTKVINVDWNISRYGRLVPVAIYESVYIDGVRLHRASCYNAAHIRDWNLGKGTEIVVIRSGDVIPIIKDVKIDNTVEPIFPSNERGSWKWKNKVDIELEDIESNRWVQIQRMVYFFTTIGVPKLREKTLENLWDAGHKTIQSITNLKESDFLKIKGIGKIKAKLFFNEIHTTLRTTPIDRYIAASSLELGIGRKLIKQLFRVYPTLLNDSTDDIAKNFKKIKVAGFGPKRIQKVIDIIPRFKTFLYSLGKDDIKEALDAEAKRRKELLKKGLDPKIKDKIFVLTGFYGRIDYKLEDYIYDNGGDFSDSVTSTTECVIAANVMDVTSKMTTALSLKIPVYTIPEFSRKYGLTASFEELEENDIVQD